MSFEINSDMHTSCVFVCVCTYKYSFERWNVIDDRLSGHLGCLHQKYAHKYKAHEMATTANSQKPKYENKNQKQKYM